MILIIVYVPPDFISRCAGAPRAQWLANTTPHTGFCQWSLHPQGFNTGGLWPLFLSAAPALAHTGSLN